MSGPLSNPYMFKSAAGAAGFYEYQIANSIRGSAGDDRTLKFTAGTPTSTTKMTMSFWVKRHTPNSTDAGANNVFTTGTGGGAYFYIAYNATLTMENTGGNQGTGYLLSEENYRDSSSWYHVILRIDTSQSTQFDRIRVYVNGQQLGTSPAPNWRNQAMITNTAQDETFSYLNADGLVQAWGGLSGKGHGTEGADLSLADCMFFDGQSYYSELGEYKNGVWIPKDPSGLTFGNNGYWLKFTNSSNLGEDFSGNDNDFTVANFSAHDQLLDSPTFGSSSSGNFPTLNPLFKHEDMTFSEGNLKHSTSTNNRGVMCNIAIPKTGKWYWEHLSVAFHNPGGDETHNVGVNIAQPDIDGSDRGGRTTGITYASYNGGKSVEADSTASYGSAWAEGDIVGIEFDADNGTINFSKNGSWQGDISLTTAQQAKEWFPFVGMGGATNQEIGIFNFGQDSSFAGEKTAQGNADDNGYGDFYYSPPSGALALCTGNLPLAAEIDPAETDDDYPQKLFNAIAYSGDGGGSQTTGFQPDFVWVKRRDGSQGNGLWDSSRGTTKVLNSDSTSAEGTSSGLTAFNSTGYTMGNYYNQSGNTYVSWSWRANGGTTSSETAGSINTTVQVNQNAGFSIVQYQGDGGSSNCTMVHGLGAKPALVFLKDRDTNGNNNQWQAWHHKLDTNGYFYLSSNDQQYTSTNGTVNAGNNTTNLIEWNRTSTTGGSQTITENGDNYVMYVWAEIEGFSKFGSYEGNGNTDGVFCYTGFKPALVVNKRTDSTGHWLVHDNARDTYNPSKEILLWSGSDAEFNSANDRIDFLANGFKIRSSNTGINGSGNDYVYVAFAHNPFKYATAG